MLEDIGPGVLLDPDVLKELHDVRIPEVKSAIRDCRDAAGKYASRRGCDTMLVRRAQIACEGAYEWTRQVLARYRGDQFHLGGNTPSREATFSVFDPHGDISVYEFFMQFEEWSKGYLSSEAKADLLFSKYLPKSLTECYEELKSRKRDYHAMRAWLIDQFGMIKRVCDAKIKLIRSLKPPKSDDDLVGQTLYYRKIHQAIASLRQLEIRNGVRVPRLQEHMESNTFLMQVAEVLPKSIQLKWSKILVKDGVTTWKVEGSEYLEKLLNVIQKAYFIAEVQARIPGNEPVSKPKVVVNQAARDGSESPTRPSSPQAPAASAANKKPQGQQHSPQGKGGSAGTKHGKAPGSLQGPKVSRWSCLIKGHEGHELWDCRDFFWLTTQERRDECSQQGCWTCLARRNDKGNCRWDECCRIDEIPVALICQGCAVSITDDRPPLSVFFCGLEKHAKPSPEVVEEALEKWIPKFKASGLGSPIVVGLSTVLSSPRGRPPASRTAAPTSCVPSQVYDTRDGSTRLIQQQDKIVKPSKERPFFVMQQLRIGGEDVLTFYDSGANVHLVEGALAERVGFNVLDNKCVSISVVGGGQVWSEYGQYACILGPDANSQYHQIECQGLERIASYVPEVDLRPLAEEAAPTLYNGSQLRYPEKVGGDRVKLLIGIRSTALTPRLHHSLPNGLGIYISALSDIHGSNICFGGTHEVFTQGFANAGMSAGHVQVMFTQMASSYMGAPYTMVRSLCEDHEPTMKHQVTVPPKEQWSEEFVDAFRCRDVDPAPNVSMSVCHCSNQGLHLQGGCSYKAAIPLTRSGCLSGQGDIPVTTDMRRQWATRCGASGPPDAASWPPVLAKWLPKPLSVAKHSQRVGQPGHGAARCDPSATRCGQRTAKLAAGHQRWPVGPRRLPDAVRGPPDVAPMGHKVQSVGHQRWSNGCQIPHRSPDVAGGPAGSVIGPPGVSCLRLPHASGWSPVFSSWPPGHQMWPGDPKRRQSAAVQLAGCQIQPGRRWRPPGRRWRPSGQDGGHQVADDGHQATDVGQEGQAGGRCWPRRPGRPQMTAKMAMQATGVGQDGQAGQTHQD